MISVHVLRRSSKRSFPATKHKGELSRLEPAMLGRQKSCTLIFVNEFPVDTALVGDSIVDNVCMNGVSTFSRGGGIVSDFYSFIPTLKSYPKIVIAVGGNNLSHYGKPGESPEDVLDQLNPCVRRF